MSLFAELKRRNVVRVAVLYVIAAWVVLQVADVLFGMMKVPEWSGKLVLGLLALGFPIAMVFSWIYEITPEGLKKQHEDLRGQSITAATARRLNIAIGVAAAIAIIGIVVDRLVPERAAPAAETTQASAVGTTPGSTATSAPAEEVPSIAVLPFADLSQAKDQEYFADGLSEELLNLLEQVEELRVIGRTSSFQFKGKNEDLRAIGETLDVAHILEGSVRKSGDKLRITAQLIRAIDGSHLWSQSYDRKLDDVFAMQDEIAAAVVGALKLRLIAGGAPVRVRVATLRPTTTSAGSVSSRPAHARIPRYGACAFPGCS